MQIMHGPALKFEYFNDKKVSKFKHHTVYEISHDINHWGTVMIATKHGLRSNNVRRL